MEILAIDGTLIVAIMAAVVVAIEIINVLVCNLKEENSNR